MMAALSVNTLRQVSAYINAVNTVKCNGPLVSYFMVAGEI